MIIATAGHVDHGKSSLVAALTGAPVHRSPEERARGMTIDLGFAYTSHTATNAAPPPDLAFIDVPGHERLLRNMLAGVAAVDLALLVVAADDGPMPQTREHLAILGLLGVPRLVVALSKIDRVDAPRLAAAKAEVQALLADAAVAAVAQDHASVYAQAPVFALAAPSGVGLPALREHLQRCAETLAEPPASGHFRLAIDRSFSVAGTGLVVTGTVLSGQVQLGDLVTLSPSGLTARVRGLQVHQRAVQQARAGLRCAVNLAGAELRHGRASGNETGRGQWLLAPAAHAPTQRLDVDLTVLASETGPMNPRANLVLHLGTAAVVAKVAALGDFDLAPGRRGMAQLLLHQPVAAAWGERFILRDAAANRTLGGGRVIDPHAPARGRSKPARLAQLSAWALPDAASALQAWLVQSPDGVNLAGLAQARNLTDAETRALAEELDLQRLPDTQGPWALRRDMWLGWQARVLAAVADEHTRQPDSLGAELPDLAQALARTLALPTTLPPQPPTQALLAGDMLARSARTSGDPALSALLLRAALAALVEQGKLKRDGLRHRLPQHQPTLTETDAALLARVVAQLQPAGLRPPIVGELAKALGLAVPDLLEFLIGMAARGLLVRVAANRFYLPETVPSLAAHAQALSAENPALGCTAAAYRDRTGIGRNLSVQVLEFLDRAGLTRFDGERHRPVA